ncbi:PAS domain S-box protein [Cytobacillus sp. Hm23]
MNETTHDNEVEKLKRQISQLEKSNKQLQQQLLDIRTYYKKANEAIVVFDKKGNFVKVNEMACEIFELPEEQLLTKNMTDFLTVVPKETMIKRLTIFETNKQVTNEFPIRLNNGTLKYIEYGTTINDIGDYCVSLFRDVTKRKKIEQERSINEQMLLELFDHTVDGILIFDKDGQFVDMNEPMRTYLNIRESQIRSFNIFQFVHMNDQQYIKTVLKNLVINRRKKGVLHVVLLDGKEIYVEYSVAANVNSGSRIAIIRDITQKRDMEIELEKSEERFRAIFEHAHEAIMLYDDSFQIKKANHAASRTFELPLDILISKKLSDFVDNKHPKMRDLLGKFRDNIEIRDELVFYMPNGEKKYLEFTTKKGIIDGLNVVVFRNISKRIEIEHQLRESDQRFRNTFNWALDGIVFWDHQFNIVDVNPAACDIYGLSQEELTSSNLTDFIDDLACDNGGLVNFNEEGESTGRLKIRDSRKQLKYLEFAAKQNVVEGLNITIVRDVSERIGMEEHIRKSDTLSVVGQLAAGIAHEIRNPVTALKGFIQLLESSIKENYQMYFDVITSEINRIETIITDFLMLAKPKHELFVHKDVSTIVKETIDLLSAQALLHNIEFVTVFEDGLPFMYCEPNRLKQVFINIIKNGIEVMSNGGTITVKTEMRNQSELMIMIRDEGNGMPKEMLSRLGEPFFTTKESGTGLGLMVSYQIIEEHKGSIHVESEQGQGTIFYITLPVEK